jgi:Uma2 family endonuclease
MTRTVDITPFRPVPLAGPITYEQFLEWDGENQHVEWVNGEVIPMAPVSNEHADVTVYLTRLLGQFAELTGTGELKTDPFQMKAAPHLPGRAPDIIFIRNENLGRLKRLYLDGPADIVIEVISPSTRGVDRGEKYVEYEQGKVPEYWLLDPDREKHEFYQLDADGFYQLASIPADGVYRSTTVPNLWIKPAWLWQRPRPTVLSIAKEWGLL